MHIDRHVPKFLPGNEAFDKALMIVSEYVSINDREYVSKMLYCL